MKKRVLITGASGFVGYHLLIEALRCGLEVYAAVRAESKIDHLKKLDIHYTSLDFNSVETLKKEIDDKSYHYIIHAAGITKAKNESQYNQVNAEFTKNLALAASQAASPLEKFIFISSLAAIGPLASLDAFINEDTLPKPVTNYGKSKLLSEQYLAEIRTLPLIIIRPTAVYGPREKDLFILFNSINRRIEAHIGKFDQQFSFIYVKDLASIVLKAIDLPYSHRAYNVSDGCIYNRYALSNTVKQLLNKKTWKFHLPVPMVQTLAILLERLYRSSSKTPTLNRDKMNELIAVNWACSIQNIEKDLAYQPQYSLEQGLKETLNWYKENKWL